MIAATGATSFGDGLYWVVGNRATSKCDTVTSNPIISMNGGGNFWFGDGPYTSLADAKFARSTINACPKDEPASDEDSAPNEGEKS